MTDFLAALLLGIIEGITEFLPISSTGHLLIAEQWLGHRSDLFNISIQAGAILAVVLIYRERLVQLAHAFLRPGKATVGEVHGQPPRDYAWKLLVSFGVTAILGLLVKALGWELPSDIEPIAWALIIGGFWMVAAEQLAARRAATLGERSTISWTTAILVGIAQVVAGVFPGTSRSGITTTAALYLGLSRTAASRFSFLLAVPIIAAATALSTIDLLDSGVDTDWGKLALAFGVAAVSAYAVVHFFLAFIQRIGMQPFVVYRIGLGLLLLGLYY